MKYKANWAESKQRWADYWRRANTGTPLMSVVARKPEMEAAYRKALSDGTPMYNAVCQGDDPTLPPELSIRDTHDKYREAARIDARYRHFCEMHEFLAESFPNINADFGPGSMAGYLGSEIVFNMDTVWFEPCVKDWEECPPLKFDPANKWWTEHYALVKELVELSKGDYPVGLPDIIENFDILSSLRGAQDFVYDLVDDEEMVKSRLAEVDVAYFEYYDRFRELVKYDDGTCYTVFQIWGPGRTAKIQCDFSAMISPDMFREYIQGSLRGQVKRLDNVLYHLDGPDAIRHLDAIMEIDEIDSLQWTSGDYGPDGTQEQWYPIYDKARAAGKSIWVKVYTGKFEDWLAGVDRVVRRYGSRGLFFHFPELSMEQAKRLLDHADRRWHDVEGERPAFPVKK